MANNKRQYKVHQYSSKDVDEVLTKIRKGMSVRQAEKVYSIPKSTLYAKLSGRVPVHCRKGPKTILSPTEENRLKKWILEKARLGFPMHPDEVKSAVQKVFEEAERENPFTGNRTGNKWLELFLKRNPEIRKRNAEILSKGRASVTEEKLREWFKEVRNYLEENGVGSILSRPRSIFNADETGVQLSPKSGRLLGQRGEKDFYEIAAGKDKETLTVLCTFSAAGEALPPMIMYPYKRIQSHITSSVPDNWPIGRSDSGWMVSSTFYEYIANIFYPWCLKNEVEFPVLFFVNGHKSHLTLELSDFCIKHKIIMIASFPNSTHITQPCDVTIFRSLKYKWREVLQQHKQETQKTVTKATFAQLFKKAFDQLGESTIQNGFKVCGLYPFNEDVVNFSKCISTRRKELNYDSVEYTTDNSSMTYSDFLSTNKFFNQYIGKEKIKKFLDNKSNNKMCNDPVYVLWQTCMDGLQLCSTADGSPSSEISATATSGKAPADVDINYIDISSFDNEKVIPVGFTMEDNIIIDLNGVSVEEVNNELPNNLFEDIPFTAISESFASPINNETSPESVSSPIININRMEDSEICSQESSLIDNINVDKCSFAKYDLNCNIVDSQPQQNVADDVSQIWEKHLMWPSAGKKCKKKQ